VEVRVLSAHRKTPFRRGFSFRSALTTVVDTCARVCAESGAQLIVGTGSNNTRQTVQAVRELSGTQPLAGALCLVPYYLRPTQAGIRAHFEAVADASPAPIVIYNIPFRTGIRASAETLLALAEHPNVVGIKHSIGAIDEDTEQLLAESSPDFAVLSGDDAHLAAITLLGGARGISVRARVHAAVGSASCRRSEQ
jgi:4-hydroxy-tetrahydrodipicolinate synthase